MSQQALLTSVVETLNRLDIEYMLTGSFASSLQGEPRSTHDIDLVVNLHVEDVDRFVQEFPAPQFYLSPSAMREAIAGASMFNLLDTTGGAKVDFWILTDDPFDISRFTRRYATTLDGLEVMVSSPEDTILAKLRWSKRLGGSERQIGDALRVLEIRAEKLDRAYIEHWVGVLQVGDEWRELLSRVSLDDV